MSGKARALFAAGLLLAAQPLVRASAASQSADGVAPTTTPAPPISEGTFAPACQKMR